MFKISCWSKSPLSWNSSRSLQKQNYWIWKFLPEGTSTEFLGVADSSDFQTLPVLCNWRSLPKGTTQEYLNVAHLYDLKTLFLFFTRTRLLELEVSSWRNKPTISLILRLFSLSGVGGLFVKEQVKNFLMLWISSTLLVHWNWRFLSEEINSETIDVAQLCDLKTLPPPWSWDSSSTLPLPYRNQIEFLW